MQHQHLRTTALKQGQSPFGQGFMRRFAALTIFLLSLWLLQGVAQADTFTVTTTSFSGPGSLNEALANSDLDNVRDTIEFNIPGGGSKFISAPEGFYLIETPVTIDATTQPGYSGSPLIELYATSRSNAAAGFSIAPGGSGTIIKGLAFTNWAQAGIVPAIYNTFNAGEDVVVRDCWFGLEPDGDAYGNTTGIRTWNGWLIENCVIAGNYVGGMDVDGDGVQVRGCRIGVDKAGLTKANQGIGLAVGGDDAVIGGSGGARNIISGNTGDGIYVASSADNCSVKNNYIGLNAAGTAAQANGGHGIYFDVTDKGHQIGSTGLGNVISGNVRSGIYIQGMPYNTTGPRVQGNFIGLNGAGTAAIPNGESGVRLSTASWNCLIGGIGQGNVISGNTGDGIGIYAPLSDSSSTNAPLRNQILGNVIGLNQAGTAAVPNTKNGVRVANLAKENRIGSPTAGDGNVISGNTERGIVIEQGAASTPIEGNLIGTNAAGTAAVPNLAGILVQTGAGFGYNNATIEAPYGTIIGGFGSARNVISGNTNTGVRLLANVSLVEANIIGLDVTGTTAIGNSYGIEVGVGNQNIGRGGAGNIVSGNRLSGILVSGTGTGGAGAQILGNFIGTNLAGNAAVGNGRDGIEITATNQTNTIGASGAANVIGGNVRHGISVNGGVSTIQLNAIGNNGASGLANGGDGINITAAGQTISGNTLSGNVGSGLNLGAGGNAITGNRIGTNSAVTAAITNGRYGIEGSVANVIGGAGVGNFISGNTLAGISVTVAGMVIQGNVIGASGDGNAAIPNAQDGIALSGAGRSASIVENQISGNARDGVRLQGTGNATLQSNRIGTNAAGSGRLPNGAYGVNLIEASAVAIGTSGAGNVISGNTLAGVYLAATGATVNFNKIGTNSAGTAAVPNGGNGVTVAATGTSGAHYVIGAAGAGNIISGNNGNGVQVTRASGGLVDIQGNFIGTSFDANAAIPNGVAGVVIQASSCLVGGAQAGLGNIISGNTTFGVVVQAGPTGGNGVSGTKVQGNIIGLNGAGSAALGNGASGVQVATGTGETASVNVTVGGTTAAERNIISGNAQNGVRLIDTVNTNVYGNFIGTDSSGSNSIGNVQNGVQVSISDGNLYQGKVGGANSGEGNRIAFNQRDGVNVTGNDAYNFIIGNSIYSNTGLGINLQPTSEANSTVTPNDAGDGDSGPSRLQNFPTITSVSESGGNTVITGRLDGAPGAYRLDFYRSTAADASGYGEGQTYLGVVTPFIINSGTTSNTFTFTTTGTFSGQFFTATASGSGGSSASGGTSEFSAARPSGYVSSALSIGDVSVVEGNSGSTTLNFTVTLSSAASSAVTVNYATANNTALAGRDYTTTNGTLTFNAGVTTRTISVPIVADYRVEANETFFVNLSGAVGAPISDAQGIGTITNDDSDSTDPIVNFTNSQTNPVGTTPLGGSTIYGNIPPITGAAIDSGTGIQRVVVRLYRPTATPGVYEYWTGSGWTLTVTDLNTALTPASGGANVTWKRSTNWPMGADFTDGTYYLRALAYDKANNSAVTLASSFKKVTDNTAPTVSFTTTATNPAGTTPISGSSISTLPPITGIAADSSSGIVKVEVRLYRPLAKGGYEYWTGTMWTTTITALNTALTPAAGGAHVTWKRSSSLPSGASFTNGVYYLRAFAYDKAGNVTASTVTNFQKVTSAPQTVDLDSPSGTANTSSASVTLDFAGEVPSSSFAVTINGAATQVQSIERDDQSVTLLLHDGSLQSGDDVNVTWDGGALQIVAG